MIKEIFDLNHLNPKSEVEGISNLTGIKYITKEDIVNSRGEFVGYTANPVGILSLFRDRLGGRNLYYRSQGNRVIVSTDILWVAPFPLSVNSLNLDYINSDYLEFQVPFGDETIYKDVKKVMPGEIVEFPGETRSKYWKLLFGDLRFDVNKLKDLIVDSVDFRKRMIEYHPATCTCYLSGGLDSGSIASIVSPENVFSGIYEDEYFSEKDYILTITRNSKSFPNFSVICESDFHKYLCHLPLLLPDPMGGLGVIPQLIVALDAFKRGYFYSFTGEGGDEVFCGYNWNTVIFELTKAIRNLNRDKYMVRYEEMIDHFLRKGFAPMVASSIARGDNYTYQVSKILEVWDENDSVENNIMRINIEIGLPAILTVDERVGLYSGVTPVSPLIDHKIVEYVASVSPEERIRVPKYLLRESMKQIVPEKVRTRYDKMGFPVPWKEWEWPMTTPLLNSLEKREIVSPYLIAECKKRKTMDRKTWALINIERICRVIDEGGVLYENKTIGGTYET